MTGAPTLKILATRFQLRIQNTRVRDSEGMGERMCCKWAFTNLQLVVDDDFSLDSIFKVFLTILLVIYENALKTFPLTIDYFSHP